MAEQVVSKPVGADGSNDKVLAAVATIPVVGLIMFYVYNITEVVI